MNKKNPERELVEEALAAMGPLGLRSQIIEAEGLHDSSRPDAVIEIGRDGDMVRYEVEVKRRVSAANVGAIAHQLQDRPAPPLLVTAYVTPPVAVQLRELGVQFIDTAGNASLNNRAFLVWVKGEKLEHNSHEGYFSDAVNNDNGRAFRPRGLQVVFTLLCDPLRINRPLRDLAQMSDVALGTVASVVTDLEQEGYARKTDGTAGARRMFNLKNLMRQWTDAYTRELRPRTLISRMYASNNADWRSWSLEGEAVCGGEPAGALLTNNLKPAQLTLYGTKVPAALVARQRLLKQPEPGHTMPVEFRRRFWNFSNDPAQDSLVVTAPALLVYADLLAVGDARCLEIANTVYEDHIARSLDQ